MKRNYCWLASLVLGCLLSSFASHSQTVASRQLWQATQFANADGLRIQAKQYRGYELSMSQLKAMLHAAPMEFTKVSPAQELVVELPNPEGKFEAFKVVRTEVMAPELAARYSNIVTLAGNSVIDPSISIRLDVTELGFHARVEGSNLTWHIDPAFEQQTSRYLVYHKSSVAAPRFVEVDVESPTVPRAAQVQRPPLAPCVGPILKRYRLAVACNGEYAVAATGFATPTRAQALSAIVTSVNRITGVYEREVAVRLQLVANNDSIVYTDAATDPFTPGSNTNANTLINLSQSVITNRIGTANFDIGHTFSTGTEGLAQLGSVCNASGKARGVTGIANPVGTPFDIDYVAHEFGHQFGANHTYNATTCFGPPSFNTNAEPGGGSTIMAYAGICGNVDNLQPQSDPYFHALSFDEIVNFISTGNGLNCAALVSTGNLAPVVNAGADFTIPANTGFVLNGTATDANPLTYSWEQVNTGGPASQPNNPSGNAPIFRSLVPALTGQRHFPRIGSIAGGLAVLGEMMPTYARTLNFRLTARDNVANGGGVCYDENVITVVNTGAGFRVTRPNTAGLSYRTGEYALITWNVAGTATAPINTSQVRIDIITSGGTVFTPLIVSTPNDGNEQVLMPSNLSGSFRIQVSAVNNVFLDINKTNATLLTSASGVSLGYALRNGNYSDSINVCSNANVSFQLNNTGINGYSGTATIAVGSLPAGLSVNFSKTNLATSDVTTVTVAANNSVVTGTYPLTFTLTGTGGVTDTRIIYVSVLNTADLTVQLASPANRSSVASTRPTLRWFRNASANTYNVQMASDTNFTNIVAQSLAQADTFYQVNATLSLDTKYFWRVQSSANVCGGVNGVYTIARSFIVEAQACDSLSNNTVVPIPTTPATINSTINVASSGTIARVDVGPVDITHSYISDLTVILIGPDATQVTLIDDVCTSNDNMLLRFADGGSTTIPCPPTTGVTVAPLQPLSAFQNKASNGTWTLRVVDGFDDDGGSLNSWSLKVCRFAGATLPIGWWNLSAQRTNESNVQLAWATRNESNTSYFEVEKSVDGRHFVSLGRTKASGNTAQLTDYYFVDAQAAEATIYYRVKQVDANGRFGYSNVVVVKQGKASQVQVLPNPASSVLLVRSAQPIQQLTLFSATGAQVFSSRPQQLNAQIPLSQLANGNYHLRIVTADGTTTERISIAH